MKNTRHIFWLIIILLFIGYCPNAQDIYFRALNTAQISSNNIRKIIQDPYGFVWVATQEGLNRFDGQSYTIYTKNTPSQHFISNIDVQDITPDSVRQVIWLLHNRSISAINYQTGQIVYESDEFSITPDDVNLHLYLIGDDIWITSYRGIKVFNIQKHTSNVIFSNPLFNHQQDVDAYKNHIILIEKNDVYAVLNGWGVLQIDRKSRQVSKVETSISDYRFFYVRDCMQLDAGTSLLIAANQLFSFSVSSGKPLLRLLWNLSDHRKTVLPHREKAEPPPLSMDIEVLKHILRYRESEILMVSNQSMYVMTCDSTENWVVNETFSVSNKQLLQTSTCVMRDNQQSLWIAYENGMAVNSLDPSAFRAYFLNGYSENITGHVNCLLTYGTGKILAGLARGLISVDSQTKRVDTIENSRTYYHLFKGPDGCIITSSVAEGLTMAWSPDTIKTHSHSSLHFCLSTLVGNTLRPIQNSFPEMYPYSTFPVIASVRWNDSVIVLATENGNGILLWNHRSHKVQQINSNSNPVRLKEDFVNTIYIDSLNNLWVLSDNSITIFTSPYKATYLAYPDRSKRGTLSIYFDIIDFAGYYWLAVYGTGLVQINKRFKIIKTYGTAEGICNIGVYKLYADGDKIFYTTNKGLGYIEVNTGKLYNYFKADGLHGDNFEEASFSSGTHTFYAGGNGGFTQVFTKQMPAHTTKPLLYITGVKSTMGQRQTDSFCLNIDKYQFEPTVQQFTVVFSALNYLNPERVAYFYRLKEDGREWVALGSNSSFSAYRFHPGKYTLQVKATNEFGLDSDIREIVLYFNPYWYETIWFKLLLVVALAGIFYALYRYRLAQIKAREDIRSRIASDLHDDIGSTLTSIRIFTDLAIRQEPKDYLQLIKQGIQEAMAATREIIWVLDKSGNTIEQLIERISCFAIPLATSQKIHFELHIDESAKNIYMKGEERRDVYLILKEFITNSLKYSDCKKITLTIARQRSRSVIILEDDGKGFDPATQQRGNGLNNITARAKSAHYKAILESRSGIGTRLQLQPS